MSDPDKLCNWLVCYKVCERRNEGAPTPELRSGRLDRAMRSKKERKKITKTQKSQSLKTAANSPKKRDSPIKKNRWFKFPKK